MFSRTDVMLILGLTTLGALGLGGGCTSSDAAGAPDAGNSSTNGSTGGKTSTGLSDAASAVGEGFVEQDAPIGVLDGAECATTTAEAHLTPVNMILMVDKSGSMGVPDQGGDYDHRWKPLKAALLAFFKNPGTTDIYASLDYFPSPGDYNTGACDPVQYKPPNVAVALTELGTSNSAFTDSLNATEPNGGTPTVAALQGSLEYASSVAVKEPDAKTMVVLITDGMPGFAAVNDAGGLDSIEGCTGNNITYIPEVVKEYAAAKPPIKTYVFGVGPSISNLKAIAEAGGTTLITIPVDDPTATQQAFLNELSKIRVREFSCKYTIPPPEDGGTLDKTKVNVDYIPGGTGTRENLLFSANCTGNNAGWKYTGETVELCTNTCTRLSQDNNAKVELKFGCKTLAVTE